MRLVNKQRQPASAQSSADHGRSGQRPEKAPRPTRRLYDFVVAVKKALKPSGRTSEVANDWRLRLIYGGGRFPTRRSSLSNKGARRPTGRSVIDGSGVTAPTPSWTPSVWWMPSTNRQCWTKEGHPLEIDAFVFKSGRRRARRTKRRRPSADHQN